MTHSLHNTTCCFLGHRDTPEGVRPRLARAVERHITQYGVTEFLVGGYGAFDRMAGAVAQEAKERHSFLRLFRLLAYLPPDQKNLIPPGWDGAYFPPGLETVPPRAAIPQANRRMIQASQYLIAYVGYPSGGSAQALAYAQTRRERGLLHLENLFPETPPRLA